MPYGLTRSISTSGFALRNSCRIGTTRCAAKLGGICTRSVRSRGALASRISSMACSSRSNARDTTGSRCWPAGVSTSECGRRSNSLTPIRFSSEMTWRESALCAMFSAPAAPVKLPYRATPSKARSAFSGSQRRSMRTLSTTPALASAAAVRSSGRTRPSCRPATAESSEPQAWRMRHRSGNAFFAVRLMPFSDETLVDGGAFTLLCSAVDEPCCTSRRAVPQQKAATSRQRGSCFQNTHERLGVLIA